MTRHTRGGVDVTEAELAADLRQPHHGRSRVERARTVTGLTLDAGEIYHIALAAVAAVTKTGCVASETGRVPGFLGLES